MISSSRPCGSSNMRSIPTGGCRSGRWGCSTRWPRWSVSAAPCAACCGPAARWELGTHANVIRNGSVRIVLHALAVDERRSMFRALPWQPGDFYGNRYRQDRDRHRQYVQQRWFPGYRSDIGSSQPEAASGIGKIALLWMLDALAQSERDADREDAASRPPEPGTRRRRGGQGLE